MSLINENGGEICEIENTLLWSQSRRTSFFSRLHAHENAPRWEIWSQRIFISKSPSKSAQKCTEKIALKNNKMTHRSKVCEIWKCLLQKLVKNSTKDCWPKVTRGDSFLAENFVYVFGLETKFRVARKKVV